MQTPALAAIRPLHSDVSGKSEANSHTSIEVTAFYIPTNSIQKVSFLHILTNTYLLFFDNNHLNNISWYLIVVFICISLTINYWEHLFIYLLTICIISFEECLFRYFAHFLAMLFWKILLLTYRSSNLPFHSCFSFCCHIQEAILKTNVKGFFFFFGLFICF